MTAPRIHGTRRFISASALLDAAGEALSEIKKADRLTWADVGAAIGKSEDQAAKYADASATMDFITFLRACSTWNGRFANRVFALFDMHVGESAVVDSRALPVGVLALMELATGLHRALVEDDDLSDDELIELGALVERCGDLIAQLRKKLALIVGERAAQRNV